MPPGAASRPRTWECSPPGATPGCGVRPGSPAYASPEWLRHEPVGPAADVYALACVAYRLLTGHDAHVGATVTAIVRSHLFATPRAPSRLRPTLTPAVDGVFERALDKDARRRTQSATRLVAELATAIRD